MDKFLMVLFVLAIGACFCFGGSVVLHFWDYSKFIAMALGFVSTTISGGVVATVIAELERELKAD
jgi:Kef-type K+ transport system membrane component KefB